MNRLLAALVVLAALALGAHLVLFAPVQGTYVLTSTVAAAGVSEPPPGGAVFELKYRGLDTPDDPLSYRSYWGFGWSNEARDPFTCAVKEQVKECMVLQNGLLPTAQWAVIELKDKKPIAFFFDTNADGKLSENEKFLPVAPLGSGFGYPYAFITSDFTLRTRDQREVPFRVMLVGSAYGGDNISYMWSPCCVLEGQATLAGEPMRLVLYAYGFEGTFTSFGLCSFALFPAGQPLQGYLPRSTLSSLIQHKGTFYRLKLSDTLEKDKTVRVTFVKDATPTGQVTVELKGKETLQARIGPATIIGAADKSINFGVSDIASALPEGRYQLSYASASYGVPNDTDWRVTFSEGPAFEVNAGQTSRVELGGPTLSVIAVDEKDRYRSDAKERTTYAKGTPIYLAPQIKGKAGEIYMRFSQKNAGANNFTDVKPHIVILDADGKQVASADMEYG